MQRDGPYHGALEAALPDGLVQGAAVTVLHTQWKSCEAALPSTNPGSRVVTPHSKIAVELQSPPHILMPVVPPRMASSRGMMTDQVRSIDRHAALSPVGLIGLSQAAPSLTCLEMAAIMEEVGIPEGVFNVVTGLGPDAGAPLRYAV